MLARTWDLKESNFLRTVHMRQSHQGWNLITKRKLADTHNNTRTNHLKDLPPVHTEEFDRILYDMGDGQSNP